MTGSVIFSPPRAVPRSVREGFEGLFFKGVGIPGAVAARDVDVIGIPTLFEQRKVRVRGESSVEDNHGLESILMVGKGLA